MNRTETLISQLDGQGYKSRIVPIHRLKHLHQTIQEQHDKGLLNKELYELYFSRFSANPPADFADARSLIIVSSLDPPTRFTLQYNGKILHAIVPPTYLHGQKKIDQARSTIANLLSPHGHRVLKVTVPNKLLAVCSGLAKYGKNNIAYVEGFGSFHRLTAFCSDLSCDNDEWHQPLMMEQCQKCDLCMRRCPSGAIRADRFLLNVDRCITFWNEKPVEVEFPQWLKPAWHNCLVGCMICQKVCPVNEDLLGKHKPGAEFSEEETRLLLEGIPVKEMPRKLQDKLQSSDLVDLADLFPRNLKVLF